MLSSRVRSRALVNIRFNGHSYQRHVPVLKPSFRWHSGLSSFNDPKNPSTETKSPSKLSDFRRLMKLYEPEKKNLAISLSALGLSTAITMCVPFGMGKIIDVVTQPGGIDHLPMVSAALGGLFLVGAATNVVRINMMNMIGERIANKLRQDTYASILQQDMTFFDKTKTGELLNRLSADTALIGKVLSDNVAGGFRSVGQGIGSVTMLFITCPKLGMIMLTIVPPLAIGAVSYGRYVKKLTAEVQKKLSDATDLAEERLNNIRVVRWFAKEGFETEAHEKEIAGILELARKRSLASSTFFGSVDFSVKMSMLAVLGYGGSMVAENALTVGELSSFLMYTLYVGFSFAGMSSFYSDIMKGIGASQRVFELVDRVPEVVSSVNPKHLPAELKGDIEFKNIKFSYPARPEATIFDGLSLIVRPNETLAVVGPSGCGKSTIMALLARFYELNHDGCDGQILIDGIDVADLDPLELRSIIGTVSQEPPLFGATIAENIAYGLKEEVSIDRIIDAAKQANAHDFIMSLPDQYNTHVGSKGLSLSGGQKQRVAIARALVKNPRILLMDEATSALDQESERLVQDAIDKAKADRTVILISHRLSSIRSADRIAVISDGRVVEQGTFDELAQHHDSVFTQVVLRESPHLLSTAMGVLPSGAVNDVLKDPKTLSWLAELNKDPQHLLAFLYQKSKKATSLALGVYFAGLLEYWLRFCPGWQVENLAVGQQLVSSEKNALQTVGQLKFVFRLKGSEQVMHWEASIKFFLLCQEPSKLENFVGPHLGENLAWRAQEIERKLGMSQGIAVKRWMATHFELPEATIAPVSHMILKGCLFYPLTGLQSTMEIYNLPAGPNLAMDHPRGWWTAQPAIDLLQTVQSDHFFAILPKMHWLSPVEGYFDGRSYYIPPDAALNLDRIELMSLDQLLQYCKQHFESNESAGAMKIPLMVAEFTVTQKQICRHISSGFIMPEKTWDPTPLTEDALRYKRRRNRTADIPKDSLTQNSHREYETRREIKSDRIRPKTNEMMDASSKRRQVPLAELMDSPAKVVLKLQEYLGSHIYNYAAIKDAFSTYFTQSQCSSECLVDCITALVRSEEGKLALRTGHLLLDAFDQFKGDSSGLDRLETTFLHHLYDKNPEQWWSLRLMIKAMTILRQDGVESMEPEENLMIAIENLLNERQTKWNAAVVDICMHYTLPTTQRKSVYILQALISQTDYVNSEAFLQGQSLHFPDRLEILLETFVSAELIPLKTIRRVASMYEGYTSDWRDNQIHVDNPFPIFDMEKNLSLLSNQVEKSFTNPIIHLVDDLLSFEALVAHLSSLINSVKNSNSFHVIGGDCEWRPQFYADKDVEEERVQVLQLALPGCVYVLDCATLDSVGFYQDVLPMEFLCSTIFNNSAFILVGFCFVGDVQKLRATYPVAMNDHCPVTNNCIELKKLALLRFSSINTTFDASDPPTAWGLATFTSKCLLQPMEKDQQCSDWSCRPLSSAQVEYAALDALAVRLLTLYFLADILPTSTDDLELSPHLIYSIVFLVPYLKEKDVVYAVKQLGFKHPVAMDSALVSNKECIVKTVAFTVLGPKLSYVAVVLKLDKTIDLNRLAKVFYVEPSQLYLSTDAELLHVFGYSRGCIGPVGLRQQNIISIFIDSDLTNMETI
ncbi:ATP-binding cassette sub-family B member 10, mitochondrial-like, partial [Thraustotheca clavata]